MKTKFRKKLLILTSCIGIFGIIVGVSIAAVPNSYISNYDIQDDRNSLSSIFVEIEANNKIGEETPIYKFEELNKNFRTLFPKFPQEYDFQVIYQQCLQLTENLSNVFNRNIFESFMSNCYKPLSQTISSINNKFTIKASAVARPTNGPAPLTVTFDARSSIDPSNETIPSDNFFWYYRDIYGEDKTIGIGPVVSYLFENPGNHKVHLTVRSSNKESKGVLDGTQTLSIDVKPKAAVISVFANSKKIKTFEKIKFGTLEGQKGIVFDGSATIAIGGRQILSHQWDISSKDGFKFSKPGEGSPGVVKVVLPKDGEYKVILKTKDNEGNVISEQYFVIISDPVAIIKKDQELGNTSTTFSFNSNASYSVTSNLRLFTWEIFDNKGDRIETFQSRNIKYQFKKPGNYTVKLYIEDELSQSNTSTMQVYVDSSDPIAQFTYQASNKRQYPSKFIFDANFSSDVDVENGYDSLDYIRSFSDPNNTNVISSTDNNKIVEVSFDSVGTQKVKLTVKDRYGKIAEIEKAIEIKSTLRPELSVSPKAITWGNNINFVANSNEEILNYSRNFGDGESVSTQSNRITHEYKKAGIYKVTLTTYGANGNENTIVDTVFVGDKNSPIGAYVVLGTRQETLRQNDECIEIINGEAKIHPAYKIERYQTFTLDPKDSLNIKGNKNNLSFYFQVKGSDIYKGSVFKHSFNEMGCSFIDFTVEDTSIGANNKNRVWFKVYNSLPTLSNLTLSFPQYGNEVGVGFNENQVRDIFNAEFDPLIVKVSAVGSKDNDGFISYFKWYYYYKDDPSRFLETKITPGDIPYAYFSLPKIPGEFMFGVTMYDSDDGTNSSEEIIGNGPIVFFPPDTKRPDIPIVTLKADKTTTDVGEEVTFNVISKIVSDREDFIQERTIYYDFDGDGERDLITKKDRVSHIYTEASDIGYTPRTAVLYRGYKGVAIGGSIVVKKGLKPMLMSESAGRFVLFRDISLGEIEKSTTCLSLLDCRKNNEGFSFDTKQNPVFIFEYPNFQKYIVSTIVEDKYANQAEHKNALETKGIETKDEETNETITIDYTGDFKLLSIPNYQENEDGSLEILVGKNLNNSVAFYVLFDDEDGEKECFVDLDISDNNEKDFFCNQVFFTKFDPKYESMIGKISYQKGNEMVSKELKISFIDFSIELSEKLQKIYEKAAKIIAVSNNDILKALLINLQKGILDPIETQSNVVAIQDFLLGDGVSSLTDKEKESVQRIVNELSDATVVSALGGSEYDIAKSEILQILPSNLKLDVEKLFLELENVKPDTEQQISQNKQRETILNKILATIAEKITQNPSDQRADEITKIDMDDIVLPNICKIVNYFDIVSEKCASEDVKIIDDSNLKLEKGARSGIKILLIIVGSLAGVLAIIISVFAIKAKISRKDDEDDEDDEE